MLDASQLKKIQDLLESAQNPVFFFDNDVDGLASFLLLRRYCGKGKGVAVKTFPSLSEGYSRKLDEFMPDYAFILDKPLVDKAFLVHALSVHAKIVWIDHHPPELRDDEIFYFNPLQGKEPSSEPTSFLCYEAIKNKKDEWIALLGCLADWYLPYFAHEFAEKNPSLFSSSENIGYILFKTEMGRIIKILNFALKDRTSNVVKMLKYLITIGSPLDILEQDSKNKFIHKRFEEINRKYEKILQKAERESQKNRLSELFFFHYSGDLSLSSELANELLYTSQKKFVAVFYIKGGKVNISIRGPRVRDATIEAMRGIEGTAGGHENACGASIKEEDLDKFKDALSKSLTHTSQ